MKKSALFACFAIAATGFLSSCDNYTTTPSPTPAPVDTGSGPAQWAATVSFSPEAGNYVSAQSVLLKATDSTASIYYTIDGSIPTTASTLYTKAIPVGATTRIKAISVKGGVSSVVAVAAFNISIVSIKPATGTYNSAQSVTLSSTVPGSDIYYTTDGSVPTQSSTFYKSAFTVKSTATINAIAVTGGVSSTMASVVYTIPLVFAPAAGTFASAQKVTLSTGTAGDTIYYTTNDSTPTATSTLYTDTIRLSSTATVKAISVKGGKTSTVYSSKYTISIPALSFKPVAGVYATAQNVVLTPAKPGDTIYYTIDGTIPTRSSTLYTAAIPVSVTDTVKAIAVNGVSTSSVLSALYQFIPWQTGITYGTVSDAAGKAYKTVVIGSQTWMAENLNYRGTGSDTVGVCYKGSVDSCAKYGRLYTWAQVMGGATSTSASPSNVKGICPVGWHVPSNDEWTALVQAVDPTNTLAGKKLKTQKIGWKLNGTADGNGTDDYGFRALPAGDFNSANSGQAAGNAGLWWSTTEASATQAWIRGIFFLSNDVARYSYDKTLGLSLRCTKD